MDIIVVVAVVVRGVFEDCVEGGAANNNDGNQTALHRGAQQTEQQRHCPRSPTQAGIHVAVCTFGG